MGTSSFVRWFGVAISCLVIAFATIVFASVQQMAPLYLAIPPLMALLALLPKSAKPAVFVVASLANWLMVLVGITALASPDKYEFPYSWSVAILVCAVIAPAINALVLMVWRVATLSNKSFKPTSLRDAAQLRR